MGVWKVEDVMSAMSRMACQRCWRWMVCREWHIKNVGGRHVVTGISRMSKMSL